MRNQDDPQDRQTLASVVRWPETAFWIYSLDQPEPDGQPALAGPQEGSQGLLLKDTERF